MKTLENPHIWYDTEFPHEEEAAGMTKEIFRYALKLQKHEVSVDSVEDKDETFASTPSFTTLRLLLTLAVAKGWHISIGDISTAFLQALVDGDFYVIPPLEFYPEGRTLWKLKKALYGLKHSPKLWQQHFASVMEKNGFRRMKSDPNLYVHDSKQLYVLAYADDLMFFGSQADVSTLIQDLQKDLLLKVTGTLNEGQSSSLLGRNLKRTSTFISVGMSPSYIDAMLELYGLKQKIETRSSTSRPPDLARRAKPKTKENSMHPCHHRVAMQSPRTSATIPRPTVPALVADLEQCGRDRAHGVNFAGHRAPPLIIPVWHGTGWLFGCAPGTEGNVEAEIAVVLHLAFSVILLAIEVPILRIFIGLVSRIVGDIIVGSGNELGQEWKNNVHYVANHTSQGDGIPVHELDDEEYNQLFDEKAFIYDPSRNRWDKGFATNCWNFWCWPRWPAGELGDHESDHEAMRQRPQAAQAARAAKALVQYRSEATEAQNQSGELKAAKAKAPPSTPERPTGRPPSASPKPKAAARARAAQFLVAGLARSKGVWRGVMIGRSLWQAGSGVLFHQLSEG
eukprot:s7297_g2.t1